jgi:hypothetical protein
VSGRKPVNLTTFLARHNATRAETSDAHIPLHNKRVEPCNFAAICAAATDEARSDLLRLRAMLSVPGDVSFSGRPFPVPDGDALVSCGNAEIVSDDIEKRYPTTGTARPFTVIEDKPEGQRRRFILWPKSQNDALQLDFRSQVPLTHVSGYLDAVLQDSAVLRDLALGFWQVELTPAERANFRFRLADGRVAQPTRLPMGLCVSVDMMQRITEILAGHPRSAREAFGRNPDVYVDGVRLAGSAAQCSKFVSFVDERARRFRVSLKEHGSAPVRAYTFVGVEFDHVRRSVVCAAKTLAKLSLDDVCAGAATFDNLRRFAGRLFHAAACNRTPLAESYFLVKKLRRLISGFNRGVVHENSLVELSPGFRRQAQELVGRVCVPLVIRETRGAIPAILFTDASLAGWGGVLFLPRGDMLVVGDRWGEAHAGADISVLELEAVRLSLDSFAVPLENVGALSVRVDNSSALAAMVRGGARAEALNTAVRQLAAQLRLLPCIVDVAYVRSAENPADFPSRGKAVPRDFPVPRARGAPTRVARMA